MRILLASIYPYAFMLLYFIIPFDDYIRALPNILLGILVVAFPFVVSWQDLHKIKRLPTVLLLVFFAYLMLNTVFMGRMEDDFYILKKVLISVGLVILYIPVKDSNKIHKAIIYSSLAAIIFSLINIVILANAQENFEFGNSAMVIEGLLMDRIYLGFLCVLSILVSYQSLKEKYHPNNRYYVANIILNILFILIIVSRITILVLIVLFLLGQLYRTKKGTQMVVVTGTIILLIAGMFALNKDFQRQLLYKQYQSEEVGLLNNALAKEPRAIIWDCAYDVSRDQGLTLNGIGFKETNTRLLSQYEMKIEDPRIQKRFLETRYNTHNQFIDFYLASGLIGFLLFTGVLTVLFFRNHKEIYPTALLVALVFYALVENLFHRQIGAYYVGFILIILCLQYGKEEIPDNEQD